MGNGIGTRIATVRPPTSDSQMTVDYTERVLVLRNPRFLDSLIFKNTTGGELLLEEGRILSRDPADGKVRVIDTGAADGTQLPIGLFFGPSRTIADAADSLSVTALVGGEVSQNVVETTVDNPALSTVIDAKTLADRLLSDTAGIVLQKTTPLARLGN